MHSSETSRPVIILESDLPAVQMRWLQVVIPNSRFIGVVRNGYAVAEGLRLKEGYGIERCARQWNTANEVMLQDASKVQHFMLVRYEDFVTQPMAIAEQLASFIGIDADPLRPLVVTGWCLGNTDQAPTTLRDANPELFTRLSPADVATIRGHAQPMLDELGYGPPTPTTRVP
jgi:hypothetical protein